LVFDWEGYPDYETPDGGWDHMQARNGLDDMLDFVRNFDWVSEVVSPEGCGGARKIFAIKVDIESLGSHDLIWAEKEIIKACRKYKVELAK